MRIHLQFGSKVNVSRRTQQAPEAAHSATLPGLDARNTPHRQTILELSSRQPRKQRWWSHTPTFPCTKATRTQGFLAFMRASVCSWGTAQASQRAGDGGYSSRLFFTLCPLNCLNRSAKVSVASYRYTDVCLHSRILESVGSVEVPSDGCVQVGVPLDSLRCEAEPGNGG